MQYVGMDVHWRQTTICILDENGRRVKMFAVRGSWQKVLEELRRIEGAWAVCYEASCGYGWLYERLKKMAQKVVVAHPGQLRLIFRSKRKNDRVDAEKLAKLLYLDEVPPVYVPSVEVRSWRAMIEHRQKLLQSGCGRRTGCGRCCARMRLSARGGLWTKKGMAWITAQELPTSMDRLQRDILLERLERCEE